MTNYCLMNSIIYSHNIYGKIISLINILIHCWLCSYVAKRIEYETISFWWKEFKSLEEQIFCKDYGRMKVSAP